MKKRPRRKPDPFPILYAIEHDPKTGNKTLTLYEDEGRRSVSMVMSAGMARQMANYLTSKTGKDRHRPAAVWDLPASLRL